MVLHAFKTGFPAAGKAGILAFMFLLNSIMPGLYARQGNDKTSGFYPGIGIGFGFFYPRGVNEYINNELSSYYMQYGTQEMFMYYDLEGSLTYKMKWFDVTALAEYAIGPKFILITNTSEWITYGFSRFSPGMLADFYLPFGTGRHAVFMGGGAQYHFMKFKTVKAHNIGFRIQAGVSLQFRKINIQPLLAFNIANAKDEMTVNEQLYDLNFTGGQLGVKLSFHQPIAHR